MSAAAYRAQIADLISRLSNNTAAAREWRTVADNRLALIVVMDSAIAALYSMMLATESQTSVSAPTTDVPLVDPKVHSADEACRFALERLRCCAVYLGSLRRETASLQTVLLETLNDGLQLLSVPRPVSDLQVSEYPGLERDISPPDDGGLQQAFCSEVGADSTQNDYIAPEEGLADGGTDEPTSTALALFLSH